MKPSGFYPESIWFTICLTCSAQSSLWTPTLRTEFDRSGSGSVQGARASFTSCGSSRTHLASARCERAHLCFPVRVGQGQGGGLQLDLVSGLSCSVESTKTRRFDECKHLDTSEKERNRWTSSIQFSRRGSLNSDPRRRSKGSVHDYCSRLSVGQITAANNQKFGRRLHGLQIPTRIGGWWIQTVFIGMNHTGWSSTSTADHETPQPRGGGDVQAPLLDKSLERVWLSGDAKITSPHLHTPGRQHQYTFAWLVWWVKCALWAPLRDGPSPLLPPYLTMQKSKKVHLPHRFIGMFPRPQIESTERA